MERLPNPTIDVEVELSKAIERIGGARVDSIVGKVGRKNADFLFDSASVIAELKELEIDQISARRFIEKCSAVYQRYRSAGKAPVQVFGTARITTQGFPEDFTREIADLYAVPIRRVIRDANEQIESTREILGRQGHRGLLILVNNGNTALDPQHVIWSLGRHLGGPDFGAINAVVFLTANMPVESDEVDLAALGLRTDMDIHVWYSAGRRGFDRVDDAFLDSLRVAWFGHLSGIVGTVAEIQGTSGQLESLKNCSR